MSILGPDGKPLSNERALAHPIREYFDFVAPKDDKDHVYFKFKMGRYEGTVFHFEFGEEFEQDGTYKVALDLVPKKFGDKDILQEELCQRMIKEFMHDIIGQAVQEAANQQTEQYARQSSDQNSDPTQPDQQ